MSIQRGAVTFSRFTVLPEGGVRPKDLKHWILHGLSAHAFRPLQGTEEDRAAGFVELDATDATDFSTGAVFQGERALFAWRLDRLRAPAAAVRVELEKWEKQFESESGRPAGKREKGEMRLQIAHELKSRLGPTTKVFDISWEPQADELLVWASSRTVIEEIQLALEKAFKVRLVGGTLEALAHEAGIAETLLKPTPELAWPERFQAKEAAHG